MNAEYMKGGGVIFRKDQEEEENGCSSAGLKGIKSVGE